MMKTRKKKNAKGTIRFLLLAIIILAVGLFVLYSMLMSNAGKPVDLSNESIIYLEVPSGSSTQKIAALLEENKLIRNAFIFRLQSKITGFDSKYKAGYYSLSQNMTMKDIMQQLQKGSAMTVRFTIPEGFDIKKTTERLVAAKLIDADLFKKAIKTGTFDFRFLKDAPAGDNRLEGFLYPDTYEVFPDSSEEEIIAKMLSRFDSLFPDAYYKRAEELGMSINQVMALASIIEREARVPADRPIISSVFYNRLAIDMPLQSCATVQYILGEQKEKLTNQDIAIDSPYNTYLNSGLPPGPICSPGIDSIKAALYPADTSYLYFLAKGDGSHVFSVTYEEFLKNKAEYIK
jgi:UPF0755 protein